MSKPHPSLKKELAIIITTIRAGKDPDTGLLHLTENEAIEAILQAVAKHLPKDLSKYWVDEETPYIHVDKLKALVDSRVAEARIDEVERIDGYAYGDDYGNYQIDRLKVLRGEGRNAPSQTEEKN